jgi:hypothetical protein
VVLYFYIDGMRACNATDAALAVCATLVVVAECCWLYAFAFSAEVRRYVDPT